MHRRALHRSAIHAARGGDAAVCGHALLEWARALRPGVKNLGELHDALADGAQRAALEHLQRARWKGGDAQAACAAVAQAFERGFVWSEARSGKGRTDGDLPPLYPNT